MHIHQPPQQNMITTTYQQAVAKMSMDATDKTCVSVVDRRLLAFVVVVCCLGLLCCFYGREGLYIFLTLHHNRGSYIKIYSTSAFPKKPWTLECRWEYYDVFFEILHVLLSRNNFKEASGNSDLRRWHSTQKLLSSNFWTRSSTARVFVGFWLLTLLTPRVGNFIRNGTF